MTMFSSKGYNINDGDWNKLRTILHIIASQDLPSLSIDAGDGLTRDTNVGSDTYGTITIDLASPSGLEFTSGNLRIDLHAPAHGQHLTIDTDGLSIDDDYVFNAGDSMTGALDITDTSAQLTLKYDGSNTSAFAVGNGGDLTITASGGDISFGNENLSTTGNLTVDTSVFHVDAANNTVGIGTAAPHPTPQFHIWAGNAGTDPTWVANDHILIEYPFTGVMQFFSPATHGYYLEWSDPDRRASGAIGYLHANDEFHIWADGAIVQKIKSDGEIEIHTQGTTSAFLDFYGNSCATYCCPFSTVQGAGSVVGPQGPNGAANCGWQFYRMAQVSVCGCKSYYIPIYYSDVNP